MATCQADAALQAVSVGGFWQGFAPLGTTGLYTLIVQQAAPDVNTLFAVRVFTNLLLQIKAVGVSSNYADIITAANRIDSLFQNKRNISLSPGYMLSSWRESEISYDEVVSGVQYSHLGGLYHIQLQ